MDALDEAPGIAVPATRRAVRRRSIAFATMVVAGLALLIVAAVIAVRVSRTSQQIEDGIQTSATVAGVATRAVNPRSSGEGTVTIVFTDERGTEHRTRVNVRQIDQYHEGDRIPVRYAPQDPTRVAIVGEHAVPPGVPALVVALFGVVLLLMGSTALRHVLQARRILRRNEWLAMPTTVRALPFEVGMRQRSLKVVIVTDPADHLVVSAEPVGIRRLPDEVAPLGWVAGLGGARFVISPPGGRQVVLVERLKRRRRALDPASTEDDGLGRTGRRHRSGAPGAESPDVDVRDADLRDR